MSPERLCGDCHAFSADIWSLGLVLVEAAVGNYSLAQLVPQAGESYETLEEQLLGSARTHEQQAPCRFSAEVLSSHGNTQWQARKVLSCACLLASASKRPRAATIVSTASSQVLIVSGSSNGCCSTFSACADACALVRWVQHSLTMMINAFITIKSSFVTLIEGTCAQIYFRFEISMFLLTSSSFLFCDRTNVLKENKKAISPGFYL